MVSFGLQKGPRQRQETQIWTVFAEGRDESNGISALGLLKALYVATKTSEPILKWIGSQFREARMGVMWQDFFWVIGRQLSELWIEKPTLFVSLIKLAGLCKYVT